MSLDVALTDDIEQVQAIRRIVFIEGQNVPLAREVDGRDSVALHLLLRLDCQPIGTARLLIVNDTGKIGRVAVLAEHRGRGFGVAIMQKALDVLRARGLVKAELGAQIHAIGFYERLGFKAFGPEYQDAGIPHRDMVYVF